MAYLNLVVNPANDIAAQRVINVPKRGIGNTTYRAYSHGCCSESLHVLAGC